MQRYLSFSSFHFGREQRLRSRYKNLFFMLMMIFFSFSFDFARAEVLPGPGGRLPGQRLDHVVRIEQRGECNKSGPDHDQHESCGRPDGFVDSTGRQQFGARITEKQKKQRNVAGRRIKTGSVSGAIETKKTRCSQ